jgi:DNA-binding CsgD family transcriptional regulator/catechol 2,3-dioxygenase-like lactoylglutathione lyase family enzyme
MPTGTRRGRPRYDDVLTPAEWRIVHAVQHGMTTRQIAQRRGISADAVKFHVANVLAKLNLRNRAELRKWFKAPGASALHRKEPLVQTPLQLGPLGQISRTVRDIPESQAWYANVLGLVHLYTFGDLAFFDCGGTRLMLKQQREPSSAESTLYLRVPDIAAAHAALAARGAEFAGAPHMIHRHADGTEEWMAFFRDPEGRPLAIMSQVKS